MPNPTLPVTELNRVVAPEGQDAVRFDSGVDFSEAPTVNGEPITGSGIPTGYLDTDTTLAANSDTKIATQKATRAYVLAQVAALVASSPSALDTLKELSDALGADANFSATMTTALAGKAAKSANLSDLANADTALTNLGGTTVGRALFKKANPGAVRFIRINADHTVDFLDASAMLTALGGGAGGGAPFFASASITKIVPGVTGEYPVINYAVPSFTAAEGDTVTVQYVNGGIGTETIVMEVDTAADGVTSGNVSLGNVSTHGDVMAAVAAYLAGLTSFFSAATWNGTTLHLTGASQGDDVSISLSGTGAMSGLSASDSGVTEVAETGQREVEVVAAVSGKRPLFSPASCVAQKSSGDDWTRDLQLCYKVGSTYTPIATVEAVYLTGDGAITTLAALNAAFHEGALAAPPVGASVILRTVASGTPEDDLTGTGFTLTIGGTHY